MSRGKLWFALPALAAAVLFASACAEPGPDPNQYLTPIAQARAADVPVYWLGRDFSAGGHQFPLNEAFFSPGIAGVNVVGIEFGYFPNDRFWGKLSVSTFSDAEWEKAEPQFLHAAGSTDSLRSADLTISNHPAKLLYYPYGRDPVHWRALVVDIGGIVVVAETEAIGSALDHATKTPSTCVLPTPNPGVFAPSCPVAAPQTPAPDLNPLIDEQTFIAVLQHLRPYPQ